MTSYPYRTYAEIDLNKLQHNLQQVRAFVGPDCRLLFVVKADAYGHGAPMCAKYSEPYVDWYATATIEEALAVRCAGVKKPILLFGVLQDHEVVPAAENQITASIGSVADAERVAQILRQYGLQMDCHIEFNTGMNRTGLFTRTDSLECAVAEARRIYSLPEFHVTGCYTHFSCGDSENPEDIAYTNRQYSAFHQVLERLERSGLSTGLRHCVSTGPLLLHPDWKMDMVRVGMLGYGFSVSAEAADRMGLHPIMRWCAKIVSVMELDKNESISYARLYQTAGREKIAVISAGYADGYSRCFSNCAPILLHDQLVTECGKICMDFSMANVTNVPDVVPGDKAILLGEGTDRSVRADQLSALIPYGVNGWTTCQISDRVPRIYIYDGKVVTIRMRYALNTAENGTEQSDGSELPGQLNG